MKTRELAVVSYMDTRLDISIFFNGRIRKLVLLLTDEFLPSSYYLRSTLLLQQPKEQDARVLFFLFFGGVHHASVIHLYVHVIPWAKVPGLLRHPLDRTEDGLCLSVWLLLLCNFPVDALDRFRELIAAAPPSFFIALKISCSGVGVTYTAHKSLSLYFRPVPGTQRTHYTAAAVILSTEWTKKRKRVILLAVLYLSWPVWKAIKDLKRPALRKYPWNFK